MARTCLPLALLLIALAGCAPRDAMRAQIESFESVGRPVPPAALDLASREDDRLADTTTTCNDDTNICTCVSDTNDNACEAILSSLCDDVTSWSSGGVGEDCPTVSDD